MFVFSKTGKISKEFTLLGDTRTTLDPLSVLTLLMQLIVDGLDLWLTSVLFLNLKSIRLKYGLCFGIYLKLKEV